MLAEVIQFYGLSWNDALDMDARWFYKLYHRIAIVEARRLINWLDVVSYPHLANKRDRQKISTALEARAGYAQLRHLASISKKVQDDGWAKLRQLGRPKSVQKEE